MTEWLRRFLPAAVSDLLTPNVLFGLTIFGLVTFVGGVVGVPFFFSRLPADYFSGRERRALGMEAPERPALAVLLRVLKNLFGAVLVLCGVAMLILPGQGVLTILVGIFFVDFPGKRRFERWLLARGPVIRTINGLRRRAGKPPIEPRASWVPPPPRSVRGGPGSVRGAGPPGSIRGGGPPGSIRGGGPPSSLRGSGPRSQKPRNEEPS